MATRPFVDAGLLETNSVTTIKILNDAVTTAKILNANVTSAKILDDNIITSKILNNNVTQAKLENRGTGTGEGDVGLALIDPFTTTSLAFTAITSFTLDTTGRPVFLGLRSGTLVAAATVSSLVLTNGGGSRAECVFRILSGATTLTEVGFGGDVTTAGGLIIPPGALWHLDLVAATSAIVYAIEVKMISSTGTPTITMNKMTWMGYEI